MCSVQAVRGFLCSPGLPRKPSWWKYHLNMLPWLLWPSSCSMWHKSPLNAFHQPKCHGCAQTQDNRKVQSYHVLGRKRSRIAVKSLMPSNKAIQIAGDPLSGAHTAKLWTPAGAQPEPCRGEETDEVSLLWEFQMSPWLCSCLFCRPCVTCGTRRPPWNWEEKRCHIQKLILKVSPKYSCFI